MHNDIPPAKGPPGHPPHYSDPSSLSEQHRYMSERQSCWAEVSKLSDYIQRYAITEASQYTLTREKYFDLYNIAVHLLRAIESLDPERSRRRNQYYASVSSSRPQPPPRQSPPPPQPGMPSLLSPPPRQMSRPDAGPDYPLLSPVEGLMHTSSPLPGSHYTRLMAGPPPPSTGLSAMRGPGNLEGMNGGPGSSGGAGGAGSGNGMGGGNIGGGVKGSIPSMSSMPPYSYGQPSHGNFPVTPAVPPSLPGISKGVGLPREPSPKSLTGEMYFEDVQGDDKKKRRKNVYSTRRNLHCHACGVTETPEWRRGPDGDHTLCNACGLHYAKALKKEREERDKVAQSKDDKTRKISAVDPAALLHEKSKKRRKADLSGEQNGAMSLANITTSQSPPLPSSAAQNGQGGSPNLPSLSHMESKLLGGHPLSSHPLHHLPLSSLGSLGSLSGIGSGLPPHGASTHNPPLPPLPPPSSISSPPPTSSPSGHPPPSHVQDLPPTGGND